MNLVPIEEKKLDLYSDIISGSLISEITATANKLQGLRVVNINATPQGGGVAEILKSMVPLMCDVGIDAKWYTLSPDEEFFRVSKMLHHCLQGHDVVPNTDDISLFKEYNRKEVNSLLSSGVSADVWLIHDVQVLPMLSYMDSCLGAWICHVDTTKQNETVKKMLSPFIGQYQLVVASMPEYHPVDAELNCVAVFPPAIDPLQPKHAFLSFKQARQILADLGLDPKRPLISQVSRFDIWKDPWGVVDAYKIARKELEGLQLALVGAMTAKDDPDAQEILDKLSQYVGNDCDIHLFSDPIIIGDLQVNAFQTGSDVILQKSIREGFGLTVTEAMWKGRPVIGGNCGGIKHQITDGINGFLVDDVPTCAERIVTLLKDTVFADSLGIHARESVRENYLMPRLLRDYLYLLSSLLDKQVSTGITAYSLGNKPDYAII